MSKDEEGGLPWGLIKWLLIGAGAIGALMFLAFLKTWLVIGGIGVLGYLGFRAYRGARALAPPEDPTDKLLERTAKLDRKIDAQIDRLNRDQE